MDIFILFCLGSIVGFVSSFFGIGGGSLIVPIFYLLYPNLPLTIVIPISLGTIFMTTTLNSARFIKAGLITNKKLVISFLITCSIGAFTGAKLTSLIDTQLGKQILAIVLSVSVFKILFYKNSEESVDDSIVSTKLVAITGIIGSFISSITGLGGGIVFTPMLISLVKMPLKLVSPYSNLAMSIATLIGVLPHLFNDISSVERTSELPALAQGFFIGNVNIVIILIMTSTAIMGSKLGIKYNHSVSSNIKKKLLAAFIALLIIKMLI